MAKTLSHYWPNEKNCDQCLFTEAETADEAVFLAVHQRMRVLRRFHGSTRVEENKSEDDVLDALMVAEPASGTLVLPITGPSGVGKSHMIRWLHAHLKLRRDRAKRHVVRIPKSASLRRVLELILEDMPAKYKPLREKLASARLPPTLLDATQRLSANLRVALELAGKEAEQRILDKKPRVDDQARRAHCQEKGLIALLRDPQVSRYFDAHEGEPLGVIARIAQRCLEGTKKHDQGPQNQFLPTDLDFVLEQGPATLAAVTRSYATQMRTPKHREEAIRFLNEVVDSALAGLVDLGGVSLADLFIEVRKQFLADDIELVLLIEDFAVLAGIQRPLLDAIIREGIRDGRRELCVMRTALAVTSGLLPETVMTRAQGEWCIDSKPFGSPDEAVNMFCDFVGGYINAARWGQEEIRQAFEERTKARTIDRDWVPSFHEAHREHLPDGDKRLLEAFGTSGTEGHPLFPLNRGTIRQLANIYLKEGNDYRFDPRELINRVLRDTLIGGRTLFETQEFPPADFAGFSATKLELDVSREIRTRCGAQAPRVSAVVYFWGDDPQTIPHAAALPAEILEAFGLQKINWSAKPEARATSSAPSTHGGSPPPAPESAPTDPTQAKWKRALEEWRKNGTLSQGDASSIRKMLAEGIEHWLDWDALLLKDVTLKGADIRLPKVRIGNPDADKAMAVAAEDGVLDDPAKSDAFFEAVRVVVRYDSSKSWAYEGGERDIATYGSFMQGLARQAARWLQSRGTEMKPELLKPACQALLIDARLLNLDGASSNTDADNFRAVFAPINTTEAPAGSDSWSRLKAGAINDRNNLREILLRQVSARQGGGDPQAVDAARILEAIKELRSSWSMKGVELPLLNDAPPAVKESVRRLRSGLENAVDARRAEIEKWRRSVVESFGDEFQLLELQEELRAVVQEANQNGVFRWRDGTYETLRARIKDVGPLPEALAQATKATKEGLGLGILLSALAQVDDRTVQTSTALITDYARFLKETNAAVAEELRDVPQDLEAAAGKIATNLDALADEWTAIEKEIAP